MTGGGEEKKNKFTMFIYDGVRRKTRSVNEKRKLHYQERGTRFTIIGTINMITRVTAAADNENQPGGNLNGGVSLKSKTNTLSTSKTIRIQIRLQYCNESFGRRVDSHWNRVHRNGEHFLIVGPRNCYDGCLLN